MNEAKRHQVESVQVNMALAEEEALGGVPNFLNIPESLQEKVEEKTLAAERMFWLRARNIRKDIVNTTLLRRAVYAEQRLNETEFMLAEMAMITEGAKEEVERLQKQLSKLAGKIE